MKEYKKEFLEALEPVIKFLKKHKGKVLVMVLAYIVITWLFKED